LPLPYLILKGNKFKNKWAQSQLQDL
jgi:hypothetical protein